MAMVLNRSPWWKSVLVVVVVVLAFVYAAPNLFGEDPAVQVSGANATVTPSSETVTTIDHALQVADMNYKSVQFENHSLLLRFPSTDVQLKAKDIIQQALGENYLVALNLAPSTPAWLKNMGAMPMKLG